MRDDVTVSIEHLSNGSRSLVNVRCDYCGCEFTAQYNVYLKGRKSCVQKDACYDCCEIKAREAVEKKYGGYSECAFSCMDKRTETNIKRYGFPNVFQNEEIKKRSVATSMEKYGVPVYSMSDEGKERKERTCLMKYGVRHYIELFKGRFIKENSPVWKGGVAYSRVERATHEYIVWRASVYARDKYTCQVCGARNGNGYEVTVNAHHIKNWRDCVTLRYDVNNGITMCSDCHMRFHSIYGERNNNEEQLQEYLETYCQIKRYAELAGSEQQEQCDKKHIG